MLEKWVNVINNTTRPWQNRELMYYLYVEKKMSTTQIAKLLGCSHATVWYWLKKHGIELRSRSPVALEPDLTPGPGLVHLVFALKGDGSVGIYNGEGHIQFCSTDKALVESIRNDLVKIGLHPNVPGPCVNRGEYSKNTKPIYKLQAISKLFAQHFLSLTPQGLLELGLVHPLDALRGFLETEGTVYYNKSNGLCVTVIFNTNLDLIHVARKLLTVLGYKSSIYKSSSPTLHYQLYLLGTTPEKEAFLNKLNPCIKWPIE